MAKKIFDFGASFNFDFKSVEERIYRQMTESLYEAAQQELYEAKNREPFVVPIEGDEDNVIEMRRDRDGTWIPRKRRKRPDTWFVEDVYERGSSWPTTRIRRMADGESNDVVRIDLETVSGRIAIDQQLLDEDRRERVREKLRHAIATIPVVNRPHSQRFAGLDIQTS